MCAHLMNPTIPIFKQGDIFEMQGPLSWATGGLCLVDKEVKWDVLRQLSAQVVSSNLLVVLLVLPS